MKGRTIKIGDTLFERLVNFKEPNANKRLDFYGRRKCQGGALMTGLLGLFDHFRVTTITNRNKVTHLITLQETHHADQLYLFLEESWKQVIQTLL